MSNVLLQPRLGDVVSNRACLGFRLRGSRHVKIDVMMLLVNLDITSLGRIQLLLHSIDIVLFREAESPGTLGAIEIDELSNST
jgi:hypothetical protein